MITVSTSLDLDNKEVVRQAVDKEIEKMDKYMTGQLKMNPLLKFEAAALREYIHAKLRGKLDEE